MTDISREARIGAAFVSLADTLTADFDVVDLLHTLVHDCTSLLDAQHGGLMLADPMGHLQLMASTSEQADFVEMMQLDAGSGPCLDCYETGTPVSVSDIQEHGDKWPEFQKAALQRGFRSVNAVPMRLRNTFIGTLNLFGTGVGKLSSTDAALAQSMADVATIGIIQKRLLRESETVAEQLQHALNSRIVIEQAKGVLSELSGLDMDGAFATLRDYARNNNLGLHAVAERVTNRTLDILSPASLSPDAKV